MVEEHGSKIPQIFDIINGLSVHDHSAFQVIVFSDTILVFNKDREMQNHYFVTYLIEFAQQLFYRLLTIGVYYKGIITYGEFNYSELNNIQAYWGHALIETYTDEKELEGLGLFVRKDISKDILILEKESINSKYDFVFLCQSYMNLYRNVNGLLPIDLDILTETDEFYRIDEDLHFFREIEYLKEKHPCEKVRRKYEMVYNWYKTRTHEFFDIFEKQGFFPMVINPGYSGSMDPFIIIAENELKNRQE